MTEEEKSRIRHINQLLYRAAQSIRILGHISWPASVREQFFARGALNLPEVSYAPFDASTTVELVAEARKLLLDSSIDAWLARHADAIEKSALMLAACGTPVFFQRASELYGTPQSVLPDQATTPLALAQKFDSVIESFTQIDMGAPPPACHLAQAVADDMRRAVKHMFGDQAPEVEVVDELSANALAGPQRIRIRRSACFTDKDVSQLIEHEAYIHVATSLNGLAQADLKLLAASHPGTIKTQEGLAVFAELVTGSIDIDRMRRLADRVLAIQMAVEGADFLEVYRYFLDRIGDEGQAFENARRVFRGGVLTGGAPFTKDVVYLDGLLRVHHFLRVSVTAGRADCIRLLFCGKLDLEDIPVLRQLTDMGLCSAPKYLPPWAADIRGLLSQLTYSSYLDTINHKRLDDHFSEVLGKTSPG